MKVLVVDDDALIRDSLKILLEIAGFTVVGMAGNGQEAVEACRLYLPDLVLMDVRMPIMDGVLGTRHIKEQFPHIKVVILTTFKDDEFIRQALKNGAEGYVLKNQSSDSIMESLRAVAKGHVVFEREIGQSLAHILSEFPHKEGKDFGLTDREYDVLELVGAGMSNREIAEKLYLSDGTVRNYITVLLEKLQLRDRTQLAIFFVKNF